MSFDRHRASIAELKRHFATLPVPEADTRHGRYRATFIGPLWLRALGGPSVALGGLPGWHGKRFVSPDAATNILRTRAGFTEALSMSLVVEPSLVDGRESATLHYGERAPIPWRWVRDELRALDADANALLGMTIIDVTLVRRLAFPFLLERET